MSARTHWTAVCQYPGKSAFRFYSTAFTIGHFSDLESTGAAIVAEEWAKVSPHPPPPIVDYLPGYLEYRAD